MSRRIESKARESSLTSLSNSQFKCEIVTALGKSQVVVMKSSITLYGPRIADGLEVLEKMVKEIKKDASFNRAVTRLDPSMDLLTEQMITDGEEVLGEYDFVIDWRTSPSRKSLRELISKIDSVLAPTGCRYTITTK
jgi:hypothetical protein